MALSVTTVAQKTRLTTIGALRAELGPALAPVTDDSVIETLIDQASAAIRSYCNQTFSREAYSETAPAFGGIRLQLGRTPLVKVTSVVDYYGAIITDYALDDMNRGWLYRRLGWVWSTQTRAGLSAGGFWLDQGTPLPNQEEPWYSVAYTAGYLMPDQDIVGASTISVDATDDSFNDSASGFPPLLVAGDVIEAGGFTNAENNGRFVVTGTPTVAKIVVSASLVAEAASQGEPRSIRFHPPATVRPIDDLEKACIETVKAWYQRRKDDVDVIEKQVGQMRLRRSESDSKAQMAIPPVCVGLLRPWRRAA